MLRFCLSLGTLVQLHTDIFSTPSTLSNVTNFEVKKKPLLYDAVGLAELYRALPGISSLSPEYTALYVCGCGYQGREQDHRTGEILRPRTVVRELRFLGPHTQGILAHVPYSPQTVQLRTHSIHPPYIDEDLQNRYVRTRRDSGTRTTH